MTRVVNERKLDATPAEVGSLLDTLSSADDRLWPTARWPAMRFDRPLGVGARGGHGPVHYEVVEYEPGRLVRFQFDPRAFTGSHRFQVIPDGDGTLLRHVLDGTPRGITRLAWPPGLSFMHNALIQDSLDRAEAELRGVSWEPRSFGPWVRTMHTLGRPVLGIEAVPSPSH